MRQFYLVPSSWMINYEVRGCQFELNNGRIGKMMMMDQEGQVLRSGRVPNLRAEIETGRSSYAMVDVLEEMGVAVKIAHPNEVKAIVRATCSKIWAGGGFSATKVSFRCSIIRSTTAYSVRNVSRILTGSGRSYGKAPGRGPCAPDGQGDRFPAHREG